MLERVILFLDGTRETEETESFFQILCQEKIRYSYWNAGGSQFEKESEWQQIKEMIVKEMDSKAGTILISDNRDVCQSALSEKYPVIVYLNGPNEDNGNSFQGVRYAIESLKGLTGGIWKECAEDMQVCPGRYCRQDAALSGKQQ